jgi:RecB family exonuclease
MLAVLCESVTPGTEVLAVERPFSVPLVNEETGEVVDRDLVERDADGHLVVVDLKTLARKYTDLQVEASLQLTVYSYGVGLSQFANGADARLRFDVLTKTKQPELYRYWTARDRAANVRLFRLASEVLRAIEVEAFHPIVGWQCKDCQHRSKCWAFA